GVRFELPEQFVRFQLRSPIEHECYIAPMSWTTAERRVLKVLKSPAHIQRYLDDLAYNPRGGAVSPRGVMRDGTAQCYSGAIFAAAALRELGHPARIMWIDAVED